MLLLALSFWWVAHNIVRRLGHAVDNRSIVGTWLLRLSPPIIGVLPLIGCAAGIYASMPGGNELASGIGGPWQSFNLSLNHTMGQSLRYAAIAAAILGVMLLSAAFWWQARTRVSTERGRYGFFGFTGSFVSVALIAGATALLVFYPFTVPGLIGTIPLVALFFISIMIMVGQLTFWHERSNIPFFLLLGIAAIVFSALDLTDNHEVAAVKDPQKAAPAAVVNAEPKDIWHHFAEWYEARPGKKHFKGSYPVYIVAAQGGGIYAAYHAAMLLARLHDECPEFDNHLFAISSVSGGSVGAGVYASLAKAMASQKNPSASAANPCPDLESTWRTRAQSPSHVSGKMEQAARSILSADFLSSLAAGALFPDFTQYFVPHAVPVFDRARWLERAFEGAWRRSGIEASNPFEESVLRLWSPAGNAPALLINTTEANSGRRMVIAPFRIMQAGWELADYQAKDEPDAGERRLEVLHFPLWNKGRLGSAQYECQGRDIPLSTSVSLSARFPWLSPAGSLTTDCHVRRIAETGAWAPAKRKVRLVDGGYFDNSAVETATDAIDYLRRETRRAKDERKWPDISFQLIVLTTNEFPMRSGYGMGDALEPVRALLSTRAARAQISINRAKRLFSPNLDRESEAALRLSQITGSFAAIDRVVEASFTNPVYTIPLGWRLSNASRDVIDRQIGRFWDCYPNTFYRQSDPSYSNADCIQLMIFHQLTQSLRENLDVVAKGTRWRYENRPTSRLAPRRLDHEKFLQCYSDNLRSQQGGAQETPRILQPREAVSFRALLEYWDEKLDLRDERWLAYALSVASLTAGVPPRFGDCLSDSCVKKLMERRLEQHDNASYRDNLKEMADSKKSYYARGYIQLSKEEHYKRVQEVTGIAVHEDPDLMLTPLVSARVLFAWITDPRLFPDRTLDNFSSAAAFDHQRAFEALMTGPQVQEGVNPGQTASIAASYRRAYTCIGAARFSR